MKWDSIKNSINFIASVCSLSTFVILLIENTIAGIQWHEVIAVFIFSIYIIGFSFIFYWIAYVAFQKSKRKLTEYKQLLVGGYMLGFVVLLILYFFVLLIGYFGYDMINEILQSIFDEVIKIAGVLTPAIHFYAYNFL